MDRERIGQLGDVPHAFVSEHSVFYLHIRKGMSDVGSCRFLQNHSFVEAMTFAQPSSSSLFHG